MWATFINRCMWAPNISTRKVTRLILIKARPWETKVAILSHCTSATNRKATAGRSPLHGFWDYDAVMANFPALAGILSKEERFDKMNAAKRDLVDRFASEQPQDWNLSSSIALKDYAENWANEILPIAKEEHDRLRFENVKPLQQEDGHVVAAGNAEEKYAADHRAYREGVRKGLRQELHKAGWRLADLLDKALP